MSRRFGTGPCVLAGLKIANGDAVIYMDSDLQDPPEVIPSLIKKFEEGDIHYKEQDHNKATYAKKISNAECKIDWKEKRICIYFYAFFAIIV